MATMHAMVLDVPRGLLTLRERPVSLAGPGELLVEVKACGVCRTDLHVVDGELPHPQLPIVPGHEVVGRVASIGAGVAGFAIGERVGVPWLGATCGVCPYCRSNAENLCDAPVFTGYTRDGGYATHAVADARYCFPLGEAGDDAEVAPWLCAGLIGWRSYRMAGEGKTLGLYGFGAAAHILAQVACWQGAAGVRLHTPGRFRGAGVRAFARRGVGRRFRAAPTRATRCRHHLRAGWSAGAGRAQGREKGWPRGLRRHPHVGHPELSLFSAVGRAAPHVGGQPDANGCARVSRSGAQGRSEMRGHTLSAGAGQRGAVRFAERALARRGGADSIADRCLGLANRIRAATLDSDSLRHSR